TALHLGASRSDARLVQSLLMRKAELNPKDRDGRTPLYEAARVNAVDCLKLLVDAGADVNAADSSGVTALIAAATPNHERCVDILLTAPTKKSTRRVEEDVDGWTPLHWACRQRSTNTVKLLLLDLKANKDALTHRGWRPIDVANYHG
ncbi:ankyrin, partial [Trichoderma citrinoviride]